MSEMIERVAKAIREQQLLNDDPVCLARAAIEAMRDVPDICYNNYRCDVLYKDDNTKNIFLKWIDAALK